MDNVEIVGSENVKRIEILEKEEDESSITDLDTLDEDEYDDEDGDAASQGAKNFWGLDFACDKGENIMKAEKEKLL